MQPVTPLKYNSTEISPQGNSMEPSDVRNVENTLSEDDNKESCIQTVQSKFLSFIKHLSKMKLEMVAFLFSFSYIMTGITSTTMILEKVCLFNYGYPSYICSDLENHTQIKSSVESLATNYQLGHSLIQTAPAALLACFIGPWSDHYGRKFPILLAIFGMSLDTLGSTICAYFLESRVEYYFIPAVFTGIFGGPVSVLAVMYSYVSDITPFEIRTMRYAMLAMAAGFSLSFGATAGGWIYHDLGYSAVFLFSASGLVLSFISVMVLLKETRGMDNADPWSMKLRNLFSCSSFKESFAATVKNRPNQGRKQILLLILSMCFLSISTSSASDINYIYVHHQFGWSNAVYSTITSIYSILSILLLVILIPLMKHFRLGDPVLGLIGTISMFGNKLGIGLSWKQGIYHIASLLGLLSGIASFAVRSRISKVVADEDLGKVFSFVSVSESLPPILGSVLVSQIFKASLKTFASTPYIVLAILLIIPLAVFIWMTRLPKTT